MDNMLNNKLLDVLSEMSVSLQQISSFLYQNQEYLCHSGKINMSDAVNNHEEMNKEAAAATIVEEPEANIAPLAVESNPEQIDTEAYVEVITEANAEMMEPIPELPVEEEEEVDEYSYLQEFLFKKGMQINRLPEHNAADTIFNQLADFIGERYDEVKPLLDAIKKNMSKGKRFSLSLRDKPQSAISSMCQLANNLYQNAFLTEYKYLKSPTCLITAVPNNIGLVQNFFTGNWLERYVANRFKQITDELFRTKKVDVKIFSNIQIVLPNSDYFELDIVAFINGNPYWLECKSSDYQQHIGKYSDFGKRYGFAPQYSFLVLSEANQDLCRSLHDIYSIQPVNINFISEVLREKIMTDERVNNSIALANEDDADMQ